MAPPKSRTVVRFLVGKSKKPRSWTSRKSHLLQFMFSNSLVPRPVCRAIRAAEIHMSDEMKFADVCFVALSRCRIILGCSGLFRWGIAVPRRAAHNPFIKK